MEQQREWTIGTSVLRFEPPNVLRAQFRGSFSLDETRRLMDVYREVHGSSGPFFLVADLSEVTRISEDTRHYFSENSEPSWTLGVIYVGARLVHRAAAKGLIVAAWLLGRAEKSDLARIHFVSTQAQAQELLNRLRGATSS
ncbi:MAG TPA: hypothetical protein VK458_00985 [Myxococcaceae bacterium]|nr:hypothetical protein [Myxococcaceae bacterium]